MIVAIATKTKYVPIVLAERENRCVLRAITPTINEQRPPEPCHLNLKVTRLDGLRELKIFLSISQISITEA